MSDTPWWRRLWLGHMLSLVVLILAGCGGSDGTGGSTTAAGMGQLLLHVTTPDQERAGLTPRAVAAGQTRQDGVYYFAPCRSQWLGDSDAHRRRMSDSWAFDTAVPGHRNPRGVHRDDRAHGSGRH